METIVTAGMALDLIIGDPRWIPHPVRMIGWFIERGEQFIRRRATSPLALKIGGMLLTLILVGTTYFCFAAILILAYRINSYLGLALNIFMMSQTLAVNSLYRHARAVYRPLQSGDLAAARQALSMIVGRDTVHLNKREIVRAAVESIAENTVDGITAPLFYGFLGGAPLAMTYKAVNTLDSMIGYKNEQYRDLGWAGARLDDLLNFLPARCTALLYLLPALFTRGGAGGVLSAIVKYARRHPSPNSGIPEAAVAGALQVQLGGSNSYGGVLSERAFMGEDTRPLEIVDIQKSLCIMIAVSLQAVLAGVLLWRLFK